MPVRLYSRFLFLFVFLFSTISQAAPLPLPAPPALDAKSYILMDYDSGEVIAEKNADMPVEPASITKMMTAYIVDNEIESGHIGMDDEVPISEKAWRMEGSRMFVEAGKKVPVGELMKGMIIQSGNDATVALAEYVAGTESAFVDMMNATAQSLGMHQTHYKNATGWPAEGHVSTARDIAILARALIRDFPDRYKLYAEKQFSYNDISQYNRNKLLWRDDSADGIKTGHTESAGFCLVGSAIRNNMRLISVVLGTKSDKARTQQSQALLNYGFRFFETHKLYAAGQKLTDARAWYGEPENVALGPKEDIYITVPRGQYDQLQAEMEVETQLEAPVEKGRVLGEVMVSLNDEVKIKKPLVALDSVPEGGLWIKARDAVLQMFN
jgi:serine-type D-Ala-D-Ala carboxypeptidase (penicillin-binding protein 5/6)